MSNHRFYYEFEIRTNKIYAEKEEEESREQLPSDLGDQEIYESRYVSTSFFLHKQRGSRRNFHTVDSSAIIRGSSEDGVVISRNRS